MAHFSTRLLINSSTVLQRSTLFKGCKNFCFRVGSKRWASGGGPYRASINSPVLPTKFVYQNADLIKNNLSFRGVEDTSVVDQIVDKYEKLRNGASERNRLRSEKNKMSKKVSEFKKAGKAEESQKAILETGEFSKSLVNIESEISALEIEVQSLVSKLPNLTHPDVQKTKDELLTYIGEKPKFSFPPLGHAELGEHLDLFDFKQAAKVSGSSFYYLKNDAALLELALIQYAMNLAVAKGFSPMITPDIVRKDFSAACGFQPQDDSTQIYNLSEPYDQLCLTGTAEIPLAGYFHSKIVPKRELPIKIVGFGRAFRAEAGAGAIQKGLYRVHQFSKVELFCVAKKEDSDALLLDLCEFQKEFCQSLGLHAQVLNMAATDLGAPAYRKIDIEAWMPGRDSYGEISSASNCTDYQSRRLGIKYNVSSNQSEFAHTLNGTACAIPRVILAILENFQQEDKTVLIPEVLQPFMFGKTKIVPPNKKRSRSPVTNDKSVENN